MRLERAIVKPGVYVSGGRNVLKVFQNISTNLIDLLVRESIQNSLDAGYDQIDVEMDFSIKSFDSNKLLDVLEGIDKKMIQTMFSGKETKHLMVSDKNTSGLDGEIDFKAENKSNLFKIIYNIGIEQQEEGAGGSWGYGKTIFYRIGIGLVLFYTRVKVSNNKFEERLIFTLIEDETRLDTFVKYDDDNKSGINFWGKRDTNEVPLSRPITNEKEISYILDIFNIKRYKEHETGTIISMPYIEDEEIIKNINDNSKYKYDDLDDYIEKAVKRWYSPRINNQSYLYGKKNNFLVTINNKPLIEDDTFFNLIKGMYNYAVTENIVPLNRKFSNIKFNKKIINLKSHRANKMSGETIGTFVYCKVHYSELDMNSYFDLNNPYNLINKTDESPEISSFNKPIIMMTRQPGMIVNYKTSGDWVPNINLPNHEYVIGIFVLNSSSDMYFNTKEGKLTYEEYFRKSEKSDHMEWFDINFIANNGKKIEPKILTRLQNQIKTEVINEYKDEGEKSTSSSTKYIETYISDKIMPPRGYGQAPKTTKSLPPPSIKDKNIVGDIFYNKVTYGVNQITIPFEIRILKDSLQEIEFELFIDTIQRKLNLAKFRNETNLESPIKFREIVFQKNSEKYNKNVEISNSKINIFKNNEFDFLKNEIISGELTIRTMEKNVSPNIVVTGKGED